MGMLDDLGGQLADLEGKLNTYASEILTDGKRLSRQSNRLFYTPNKGISSVSLLKLYSIVTSNTYIEPQELVVRAAQYHIYKTRR